MVSSLRIAAYAATLFFMGLAYAAPVRYSYSGSVTEVRDYKGTTDIGSYVSVGDRFFGSFYYDPRAPFSYWIEPQRALFVGPYDPSTVTINSISATGSSGEVQLFDEYPNYPDNVFLASLDNDMSDLPSTLSGFTAAIRLNFVGEIIDMTLPDILSLTDFSHPWFSLTGYASDGVQPGYFAWGVHGYIDALTIAEVPEPEVSLLLLVAFVTLALFSLTRHRGRLR